MEEKILHEYRVIETEDGFRIEIKGDKEKLRKMIDRMTMRMSGMRGKRGGGEGHRHEGSRHEKGHRGRGRRGRWGKRGMGHGPWSLGMRGRHRGHGRHRHGNPDAENAQKA